MGEANMAKGWMGVALLALGLSMAPAAAQAPYLPDQGMPGPMADPVPYSDASSTSVPPRLNHGVRATVGFHWDGQAVELSGFYLSQNSAAKSYANPGSLDTFFNVGGDFTRAPLGFEGDNGLWLQADVIKLRLQTALGS